MILISSENDHPQHHIYFVIEEGELVELTSEHPEECMKTMPETEWAPELTIADPEKCDLAFEEEMAGFEEEYRLEDDPPPWEDLEDGAYRMKMNYHYRSIRPGPPDYEWDTEFWWWAEGDPEKVAEHQEEEE